MEQVKQSDTMETLERLEQLREVGLLLRPNTFREMVNVTESHTTTHTVLLTFHVCLTKIQPVM